MPAKCSAIVCAVLVSFALAGCVTAGKTGPSVDATPGRGKSPEQFSRDERACQIRAFIAVGRRGNGGETNVDDAIVGTAVGAGLGSIIGAGFGHFGSGAAIGAGTGLMAGSLSSESKARAARAPVQKKYDSVYVRCMTGRGHRVGR